MKSGRSDQQEGQGLVEYALILVLVAIVVIAVLKLLGPIISNEFSSINDDTDASSNTNIPTIDASASSALLGLNTNNIPGSGDDEPVKDAQESLENWRKAWAQMYESGTEAWLLSRDLGQEAFEFLRELEQFDQDEAFQVAIDDAEQQFLLEQYEEMAEILKSQLEKLEQISTDDWLGLIERSDTLLSKRCAHLEGARVTPELNQYYDAAREAFAELPNGDQLIARADELQAKILVWDLAVVAAAETACPETP